MPQDPREADSRGGSTGFSASVLVDRAYREAANASSPQSIPPPRGPLDPRLLKGFAGFE